MKVKSIRSFIGAKDLSESRRFYRTIGFNETKLSEKLYLFQRDSFCFYLQDYYVPDWVNNSMLFLETENLKDVHSNLSALKLTETFPTVRLSPIELNDWGSEFFLHDPAGVLWHIGQFNNKI